MIMKLYNDLPIATITLISPREKFPSKIAQVLKRFSSCYQEKFSHVKLFNL